MTQHSGHHRNTLPAYLTLFNNADEPREPCLIAPHVPLHPTLHQLAASTRLYPACLALPCQSVFLPLHHDPTPVITFLLQATVTFNLLPLTSTILPFLALLSLFLLQSLPHSVYFNLLRRPLGSLFVPYSFSLFHHHTCLSLSFHLFFSLFFLPVIVLSVSPSTHAHASPFH